MKENNQKGNMGKQRGDQKDAKRVRDYNGLEVQSTTEIKQAIPESLVLSILPIFHGFGHKDLKCITSVICGGDLLDPTLQKKRE